jgi:chromosome partitioning protein
MKVLTFYNLKGGVAKTTTSINVAHILSQIHGYRVLLIDNDKQGNTSKFFDMLDYDHPTLAEVLTEKGFQITDAIRPTQFERLHVLPSNMNLVRANMEIMLNCGRAQQTRLRNALDQVRNDYDFVIIDNAPDYNMSAINSLVASDHVIVPIKIDKFTFNGVKLLHEQVDDACEFNPGLKVLGGLVTMYYNNDLQNQGIEWLNAQPGFSMFKTIIRRSVSIDRMTFTGEPIVKQSPNGHPATDYKNFVAEYLTMCG